MIIDAAPSVHFFCYHERQMEVSGEQQICVVMDGWIRMISLRYFSPPVYPVSLDSASFGTVIVLVLVFDFVENARSIGLAQLLGYQG